MTATSFWSLRLSALSRCSRSVASARRAPARRISSRSIITGPEGVPASGPAGSTGREGRGTEQHRNTRSTFTVTDAAGETTGPARLTRAAVAAVTAAQVADTLLGLEALAEMLEVAAGTARRAVTAPGFPASVVPGMPATRRWPLPAVRAWALAASLGGLVDPAATAAAVGPVLAADDAGDAFVDVEHDLAARYRVGHTKAAEVVRQAGFPASVVPGLWRVPLPALRRWEVAFSLAPTWAAFGPGLAEAAAPRAIPVVAPRRPGRPAKADRR